MRHPVECSIRSAFIGGVFHMSTVCGHSRYRVWAGG